LIFDIIKDHEADEISKILTGGGFTYLIRMKDCLDLNIQDEYNKIKGRLTKQEEKTSSKTQEQLHQKSPRDLCTTATTLRSKA